MQPSQQRKVITIDRGLFLVRYTEAEDAAFPPSVRLTPAPDSRGEIRLILHPDESEPVLRNPGTSLVVRADMPGRLTMDISSARTNGSVAAKVRIEALAQAEQASPTTRDPQPAPMRSPRVHILGHVASRGDVKVEGDAWLAGPTAPARIEGFQIDWPEKPEGLELRYTVKTAQSRGAYGPWAGPGAFVGSRGRALPIVGLLIETGGPAAPHYRCTAETIFLGSPLQRIAAPRIEATGPTGREPLVGLRFSIAEIGDEEALSVTTRIRPPLPIERVKIFRSQALDQRPIV